MVALILGKARMGIGQNILFSSYAKLAIMSK
jgi:hypothetical protein